MIDTPKLPEPAGTLVREDMDVEMRHEDGYSADQMNAAVLAERERCAELCDQMVLYTGLDCAQAIWRGEPV